MNFDCTPYAAMDHPGAIPWQRPPSSFYGSQFQQQGPPGPFQHRPWGNGNFAWQPPKCTNRHNDNSPRPKRPRKEPTFIDYCDVCDRGFKNNAKKTEHYQQHVKCDEPGCSFEAHFKIVAIHKQNLHGPNALQVKVETPEEIKRWREERKRKYPSCSNIQKKAEKLSERERHGNVLDNKNFGKMRHKKQITSVKETSTAQIEVVNISKQEQSANQNDVPRKSLLFSNSHISSGEVSSEDDDGTVPIGKNLSALGSLMQSYASSSESELEDNASPNVQKVQEPSSVSSTNIISAQSSLDHNPAKILCDTSNLKNKSGSKSWGNNKSNKPGQNDPLRGKKRQSLLEMLLANDIRKERNHILQCVRFVVENKFFEPEVLVTNEPKVM